MIQQNKTLNSTAILFLFILMLLPNIACAQSSVTPLLLNMDHSMIESPISSQHSLREILKLKTDGYINAVAWNNDGSKLAAISDYGSIVTVWSTKDWSVITKFKRYSGAYSFNSLAFMSDDTLLTSAPIGKSEDPRYESLEIFSLIQWDIKTGKVENYIPEQVYPPTDLSSKVTDTFTVSKDGAMIAATNGISAFLYDVRTRHLLRKLSVPPTPTHPDGVAAVAFSPNNQLLAVSSIFGLIHFFNPKDGSVLESLTDSYEGKQQCATLAFNLNGGFIACGKKKNFDVDNPDDIAVDVWQVKDLTKVASLKGSELKFKGKEESAFVRKIAWSPIEDVIAVGDDKSLRVWRIKKTGSDLLLSRDISHGTFCVDFSPQGMLAATNNNEIVIYQ